MIRVFFKLIFSAIFFLTLAYGDNVRISTYNVNKLYESNSNIKKNKKVEINQDENATKTPSTKMEHIARVLLDLKADIIALQGVESSEALNKLNKLVGYKYHTISMDGATKVAVLSNYKILSTRFINGSQNFRNILETHIKVNENEVTLFVVNWHTKQYPETYRQEEAQALKWRLIEMSDNQDYIVLGDFNSNYNEYKTFKNNYTLNDTFGETGINHILHTITPKGDMVTRDFITKKDTNGYLYNLWMEVEKSEDRFSQLNNGKRQTHDNMIVSKGLFNDKGINYVDESFKTFRPEYLYDSNESVVNKIKSWSSANNDHLPIYADFDLLPFKLKVNEVDTRILTTIDKLFQVDISDSNFLIKNVVALLQDEKGTILKDPLGRAMYVVGHNDKFRIGNQYEVDILALDEELGLRVIKEIGLVVDKGAVENIEIYKIYNTNKDFNNLQYQNEVISEIKGIYSKGYLTYSGDRQTERIKIVFRNDKTIPQDDTEVVFKDVLVSFEKQPALIVQ